jgi:hypothetical protein
MTFPPIKPDRCLLWITLHPDDTARTRYAALLDALRPCRLHPLDTTASAELVIVEESALKEHLDTVRAALGENDMIHRISKTGDRLYVNVIARGVIMADSLSGRPAERRPPWQQ